MKLGELVFLALLAHHLALRCAHGKWDVSLDDGTDDAIGRCWCIICDSGMST